MNDAPMNSGALLASRNALESETPQSAFEQNFFVEDLRDRDQMVLFLFFPLSLLG